MLVASALAPGTFASSLSARSARDQGLVTGLATGLHYLLTVGTQDTLQAVAAEVVRKRSPRRLQDPVVRQRALTLAADLAVIPLGLALRRVLPPRPGEAMIRGALRQAGWRFAVTGVGGALLITTKAGASRLDERLGAQGRVAAFPVAVPVGLAVAYVLERRREDRTQQYKTAPGMIEPGMIEPGMIEQDMTEPGMTEPGMTEQDMTEQDITGGVSPHDLKVPTPGWLRSLGIAGGVVGALAGAAYAEHAASSAVGKVLASALPGGPQLWKLAGHGVSLGALGAAGVTLYGRAMRKIEAGTSAQDSIVESDEASRWTTPFVSGGPESLVPWETLGREGRRHVLSPVRPQTVFDRPEGAPDLSIETVMRESAKATPVQVYVGLDSAPTTRERVDLALAEMERTGAFDRSLIMLVSPTGTGYVNYVAVAAAQYLTRGDVATVTMQYSKRPSPLSLTKVKDAREQNRLLWLRIVERLHDRPQAQRPRVVVFGESLGAHTSQDVFLHWGTLGPQALGIDRALWIGTPYGSGWMHEITGPERFDVDPDAVAVVNDFAQLEALGHDGRSRLRYLLVSHDNDGVTKFGPDLLTTAPAWLGDQRPRPEVVPGASPRGILPTMRWRPITTFFQSLVDMKNAQTPGAYRAWAHDYRPDLARFISEMFDLRATPRQLSDIENALAARETYREQLFAAPPTAQQPG
jgi:Alpha/beta-hydrolase family/Alpha/beta-hydrolase family N-terminus